MLRKRPYVTEAIARAVLRHPAIIESQPDGRLRAWGWVIDYRVGSTRALRVIVLADGETLFNAFFDWDFADGARCSCTIIPKRTVYTSCSALKMARRAAK